MFLLSSHYLNLLFLFCSLCLSVGQLVGRYSKQNCGKLLTRYTIHCQSLLHIHACFFIFLLKLFLFLLNLFQKINFKTVTLELHHGEMRRIGQVQCLQDKLREKITEIEEADEICENEVRGWIETFKSEIGDEKVQVLSLSTDPITMKEGSDMIIESLTPRLSVKTGERKENTTELLAYLSKGLNDHYDKQGCLAHLIQ